MKYLLILLFPLSLLGQNLVPNPSFEDTVACPTNQAQIDKAVGWSSYRHSPDLFHVCTIISAGIPWNGAGYQYPYEGEAYAGLVTRNSWGMEKREMIGSQLLVPLTVGTKYFVSLHASLCSIDEALGYTCATNKIGTLFSTIPYSWGSPAPYANFAQVYTDSVITDTLGWTTIRGTFIADSAYQYIVLGNFFDDFNIDTVMFYNDTNFRFAYYFLDNICVSSDSSDCDGFVGVERTEKPNNVTIYPNPSTAIFTIEGSSTESWQVHNAMGQLVKEGSGTQVNLRGYAKGIYLLRVGEHTQKLVLE